MPTISDIMFSRLQAGAQSLGKDLEATRSFLLSRINPDGGFQGRTGQSDLYYTAFGIDILLASSPSEISNLKSRISAYLLSFTVGDNLTFMDLVSLARARMRLMPDSTPPEWRQTIARHLARYRAANGGYHTDIGASVGSATATFMAWIAHEALGITPENPDTIISSLSALATPDGAYSNLPEMPVGNTPSTAATQSLLHHFGLRPLDHISNLKSQISDHPWLLNQLDDSGGFRAFPQAPIPDLLSTGTALFALSLLSPSDLRPPTSDF